MNNLLKNIIPCDMEKPFIFISYSSADADQVYEDVIHFQRLGYNIWIDEINLDKTNPSWKDDAIEAIADINCELVVFYVSRNSLKSTPCYNEMMSTTSQEAMDLHFGPVKFIAVDVEEIGDIQIFARRIHDEIRHSQEDKEIRQAQAKAVSGFLRNFFNSSNEKVRVHPKYETNRKLDYYEDILATFPDEARIYDTKTVDHKGQEASENKRSTRTDNLNSSNNDKKASELYTAGENYYYSQGVKQDFNKAFQYFKDSAALGNNDAMCKLGECFHYGNGTKKDEQQAFMNFEKSALAGNMVGQAWLAYSYYYGYGVKQDYEKAAHFFLMSAEQGYAYSQDYLGNCLRDGKGIKQDYKEAYKWYMKAAEQNNKNAQSNLGYFYSSGLGVEKNSKKAVEYFKLAAAQGDNYSRCKLADAYYRGDGIEEDPVKAFEWYSQAAKDNYYSAQAWLGYFYDQGVGVDKDDQKSEYWYRRSAEQGYDYAQDKVGDCYYYGKGVAINHQEALKWYQKAAEKGNEHAKFMISLCDSN